MTGRQSTLLCQPAYQLQRAKIWFPENGRLHGTGGVLQSPGDRGTGKSNHHLIEQKGCAQSDMMWYLTNEQLNQAEGMTQSSLLPKNTAETSSVSGITGSDDQNRFWTTRRFGRDQPKIDPSQDTAVHASRCVTSVANVDQRLNRTSIGGNNLPPSSWDPTAVGPPPLGPPTLSESYEGSSSTASTIISRGNDQEVIVGCGKSAWTSHGSPVSFPPNEN